MICPLCSGKCLFTGPGYSALVWDDDSGWVADFYCHNDAFGEPVPPLRERRMTGPKDFTYHDEITGDCYRCSGTGEIREEEE